MGARVEHQKGELGVVSFYIDVQKNTLILETQHFWGQLIFFRPTFAVGSEKCSIFAPKYI